MDQSAILFYVHDPMCSWCWGYRPVWLQLKQALNDIIQIEYVVGGLAPDTQQAMPLELQQTIQGYWKKIQNELGAEFNFDFWQQCQPRRSTYPACRAVIAAKMQGQEMQMVEAIQRAYYLRAMNPSNDEVLIALAQELELDVEQFCQAMSSAQLEQELQRQIEFVRQSPNRGFPGLLLQTENSLCEIPVDYKNAQATLRVIEKTIATT